MSAVLFSGAHRKIFAGFKSRCTIPFEWRYSTPETMSVISFREGRRWKQWRLGSEHPSYFGVAWGFRYAPSEIGWRDIWM
jgi:hypothetical protein